MVELTKQKCSIDKALSPSIEEVTDESDSEIDLYTFFFDEELKLNNNNVLLKAEELLEEPEGDDSEVQVHDKTDTRSAISLSTISKSPDSGCRSGNSCSESSSSDDEVTFDVVKDKSSENNNNENEDNLNSIQTISISKRIQPLQKRRNTIADIFRW